jgi:nitrous oxidase accessory protein NosD
MRPCTITRAVAKASNHDTVIAKRGVYHGGVVINKSIVLRGQHGAIIDATGSKTGNGVQITGPGGSGSTVEDFVIRHAAFEGILVGSAPITPTSTSGAAATSGNPVSNVTIANNELIHNGTDFGTMDGPCFSTPEAPGDCGETIHLVSATHTVVRDNHVIDNVGGILLSDEFGPNAHNVIRGNTSEGNVRDCGIILAAHSTQAVDPTTLKPTGKAGIFDNIVEDNTSSNNGTQGQGGGVILAGGAADSAVYDNIVRGNTARGDGLAGIVIHQHFAGDVNGNVIEDNTVSNDNLTGDMDFTPADTSTTGIFVAAGPLPGAPAAPGPMPGPITHTVIRDNHISHVQVGIWTLGVDAQTSHIANNVDGPAVTTPISVH